MRQRWLTDTSISPRYPSDWGRGAIPSPSCMQKRALLISEGRQREREKERKRGCRGGWGGKKSEIASSQFRFDEGHSVSSGWAGICVTLAWLGCQKCTVQICRDLKMVCTCNYKVELSRRIVSYRPLFPSRRNANPMFFQQRPFLWLACIMSYYIFSYSVNLTNWGTVWTNFRLERCHM